MFESMYRILTLIDSPTRCLGLSTATNHVQYCTSIHRDLKAVSQLHVPSPQSRNRRNRQVNASQCSAHWLSLSHTTAPLCVPVRRALSQDPKCTSQLCQLPLPPSSSKCCCACSMCSCKTAQFQREPPRTHSTRSDCPGLVGPCVSSVSTFVDWWRRPKQQ